jgi:hypothetical protein
LILSRFLALEKTLTRRTQRVTEADSVTLRFSKSRFGRGGSGRTSDGESGGCPSCGGLVLDIRPPFVRPVSARWARKEV